MSIPPGFTQYSHTSPTTRSSTSTSSSHHFQPLRPTPPPPPLGVTGAHRTVRWGSNEAYSQLDHPGLSQEEEEEEGEEEEEEWKPTQTILAITATRGKVGACYYDLESDKLLFLPDQVDTSGWDLVRLVVEQISPTLVLTAANADPPFLSSLSEILSTLPPPPPSSSSHSSSFSGNGPADPSSTVQIEYRPPREFYSAAGRNALAGLGIDEGSGYDDHREVEEGAGEERWQERDEFKGEGEDLSDQEDAYAFGKGVHQGNGRKKGKFSPRRRARSLNEGQGQGDRARRNAQLRLESFLNGLESSALTLGCAASLLAHLARIRSAAGELDLESNENEREGLRVKGVELLNLEKVMHIGSEALTSLQIFSEQAHATTHSDRTKEGLSLFGILNTTKTPSGKNLMRSWFLRPSLDLEVIEGRHRAVECFLVLENQTACEAISSQFKNVRNISQMLTILKKGRGRLRDWKGLWAFLFGAIMVRDAILSLSHRRGVGALERLLGSFDPEAYKELGEMINDIIDWEESQLQPGRICVKRGVNADLDDLRRTYAALPDLLSNIAREVGATIPRSFTEHLSIVYFPQLGYLNVIPRVTDERLFENVPDGWNFQFVTEDSAYFKSDRCRDLDKHLGDVYSFISDKEIDILHALLKNVVDLELEITAASDALAEVDCLLAFAEGARTYEWNKPTMTEDPVCKIRMGRHPLVELCVDNYVKNDAALLGGRGEGWNAKSGEEEIKLEEGSLSPDLSMLIITGANYSGKSVFLKMIAVLTFMAQIGSYVPAEAALIGLTDRILTRISTKESITRGSSAFMIDLQQISFILRNATARSLVLVDEFGKGTESGDGAGLFCGVIEELIKRGGQAPRAVVATHFQDVFVNGMLPPSLPIGLAHMEIMLHEAKSRASNSSLTTTSATPSFLPQDIAYLYRLAPGISSSSHAAACAARFGIDEKTVARATEITNLLSRFEIDALFNEDLDVEETEELEESEEVARKLIAWDLEETDVEQGLEEEDEKDMILNKLRACLGIE